jgi:hypothetical protein
LERECGVGRACAQIARARALEGARGQLIRHWKRAFVSRATPALAGATVRGRGAARTGVGGPRRSRDARPARGAGSWDRTARTAAAGDRARDGLRTSCSGKRSNRAASSQSEPAQQRAADGLRRRRKMLAYRRRRIEAKGPKMSPSQNSAPPQRSRRGGGARCGVSVRSSGCLGSSGQRPSRNPRERAPRRSASARPRARRRARASR